MRLLDCVAQCSAPVIVRQDSGELWRLTGANDYARELTRCPLRYVLSDELVRACTELAYSEGAGLASCLDLIHFPAERLWIEWNATPQRQELARLVPECAVSGDRDTLRTGVLISAHPGGRSGTWRTFWLSPAEPAEPILAPVETLIELEGGGARTPVERLLDGSAVAIGDPENSAVDDLLRCASFRLDPLWLRYYRCGACTPPERTEVTRRSLGTVAFDSPILLALFLLLALRTELSQVPIPCERLNAKRARLGKRPLLSHIEVSCPVLQPTAQAWRGTEAALPRTGPRLHQVRGHIVRRDNAVFWRRSHWRGHLRLGCVRSRTVTLTLPAAGRVMPL